MARPNRPLRRAENDPVSRAVHRKIAGDLFNYTWSLLDARDRSAEEDEEMVHAAHASRYHWGVVGRPLNRAVGEWQISRVYAVLGRSEPADHHARRALDITKRYRLSAFHEAYAYEALARSAGISGRRRASDRWLAKARATGRRIRDPDDRRMLLEDLATIS